jgi:hypothetical protein
MKLDYMVKTTPVDTIMRVCVWYPIVLSASLIDFFNNYIHRSNIMGFKNIYPIAHTKKLLITNFTHAFITSEKKAWVIFDSK